MSHLAQGAWGNKDDGVTGRIQRRSGLQNKDLPQGFVASWALRNDQA
jgi:hypothetical protein